LAGRNTGPFSLPGDVVSQFAALCRCNETQIVTGRMAGRFVAHRVKIIVPDAL